MPRHDYAFPFRIDTASRQAAQSTYAAHVEQMIRQVLLTAPGERADLPQFGCGLRQLIFAPHNEALNSTTQMLVQQALTEWLGAQIQVQSVTVASPAQTPDLAQLLIQIEYILIETRTSQRTQVQIV